MKSKAVLCLSTFLLTGTLFVAEQAIPKGVHHLDHVFVIMIENHRF